MAGRLAGVTGGLRERAAGPIPELANVRLCSTWSDGVRSGWCAWACSARRARSGSASSSCLTATRGSPSWPSAPGEEGGTGRDPHPARSSSAQLTGLVCAPSAVSAQRGSRTGQPCGAGCCRPTCRRPSPTCRSCRARQSDSRIATSSSLGSTAASPATSVGSPVPAHACLYACDVAPDPPGSLPFSLCLVALPGPYEEDAFVRHDLAVFSNAKNHRMDADVPLVVPTVNSDHLRAIPAQRTARGLRRGPSRAPPAPFLLPSSPLRMPRAAF